MTFATGSGDRLRAARSEARHHRGEGAVPERMEKFIGS